MVAENRHHATSAQASLANAVKERILALVVEKTGYPKDMLDLDLDLEADLGVDTVKQAEMFAAIREIYNIPRDENRKLRDYPTLAHVIRFVYEKRPDLAAGPAVAKEEVQPATAAPTAVAEKPAPAATSSQVVAGEPVKERILALVVEKTGYPKDMLDLDLDLEADLGVDTVKQAEMFAAIREIYNIPRDENRKLRDFPTLAHVIRFVYEKRPDLAGAPAAPSSPIISEPSAPTPPPVPVATATADAMDAIKEKVLEIVAEKTGYPKDMLDLDLDLEADLGIDTVKQAEMFAAVRAAYNIPRDENLKLRDFPTLAHVIKFARDRQPGLAKAPAASSSATQEKPEPAQKKPAAPASRVRNRLRLRGRSRQFRCRQSHSAPRTGSQLASAACPLQTNRCDARIRPPRGHHAGQRRCSRRAGATATDDGCRSSPHRRRAGCGRTGQSPQELAGRGSGARSLLAARAGQRGRPQRNGPRHLA